MGKGRRQYDDDDGRTIVDMSGVERPSMFGHFPSSHEKRRELAPPEEKPQRPWEERGYNREERRAAMLGALKAGLLIGGAYIVGLGALIAILMYVIW